MEGEKNQYLQQEEEVKSRGLFDFMKKKEEKEEKKEECEEEKVVAEMENVHVTEVGKLEENKIKEEEKEEKKESLFAKLHHSDSSSSSSSDEEEIGSDGEKRKKKKGLKQKIKDKFGGDHKNEEEIKTTTMVIDHEVAVPTPPSTYNSPPQPTYTSPPMTYASPPVIHTSPPPSYAPPPVPEKYEDDTSIKVEKVDEVIKVEVSPHEEEKKGFLEKIKDKLPGHKKEETSVVCEETVSSPDGKEKKGILGKIMDKIPGYNKAPAGEETKGSENH